MINLNDNLIQLGFLSKVRPLILTSNQKNLKMKRPLNKFISDTLQEWDKSDEFNV